MINERPGAGAMYLMFGDEADAEQGRGQKFFVYGAVFINAEQVAELHDDVQKIRDKFGYGNTDSLKFSGARKTLATMSTGSEACS